ncbi:hypothetical protein [Stagnimonas aquatica]|uniref:hypothetical protein n=1 Tax=Stagnimonas aquatica TaxID=2689987 RepID=UPI0011CE3C99|nr:hypothetical protein [Stagnimonas aquatica]
MRANAEINRRDREAGTSELNALLATPGPKLCALPSEEMKKAWEPFEPGVIYDEEEIQQLGARHQLPAHKPLADSSESGFEGAPNHDR